jgi:hypothetical protein
MVRWGHGSDGIVRITEGLNKEEISLFATRLVPFEHLQSQTGLGTLASLVFRYSRLSLAWSGYL